LIKVTGIYNHVAQFIRYFLHNKNVLLLTESFT
jgi:hypothetical protein